MSTARHENVKWVDVSNIPSLDATCIRDPILPCSLYGLYGTDSVHQGLRGIASLLVVWTHIARAFDEDLFKPVSAEKGVAPRFFQYPILRILIQGRIGVSIFSLVTGYVCALKPIRQFRAGQHDAAFVGIAKSAFRRIPRLFLPTTFATVIIWFICQFGVFEVSNRATGWWLNYSAPNVTPYIGPAVRNLLLNIITTWTKIWNAYDINQWTLQPLLKGAFLIYVMLFATAYTKPRYRMIVELGMFVYYYVANECTSTPQTSGVLLTWQ
jgi:peptidoglycan/LPS O-acetylase OafA/YrhL